MRLSIGASVLRGWASAAVLAAVAFVGASAAPDVQAKGPATAASATVPQARAGDASAAVRLSDLPVEARDTYRLILSAGPFPYERDGTVFGNRERLLPRQTRGYYREYTVPTPGLRHRGARRIVCGGQPPSRPEVCYYSHDHYANFRRIADSDAVNAK